MSKKIYCLDQYPFDIIENHCNEYIKNLDWDGIRDIVYENDVAEIDITDCIDIFPHIWLEKDYRLICYISHEYHGMLGKVAAIKDGEETDAEYLGCFIGFHVKLPDAAANPLEVIYNDGTAQGYLEAVLFSDFINYIPNANFRNYRKHKVIIERPDDIFKRWDVLVETKDMTPKLAVEGNDAILYLYKRKHAGVFLPSDGRDEIILFQYRFDRYGFYYRFYDEDKRVIFSNHPSNELKRYYSENKCCCLFDSTSILVAKQKTIDYKIIVNAIKCTHCGDIIESTPDNPEVTCSCGICTVKGGHEHITRRFYDDGDYIDLSVRKEIIVD